MISIIVAVSEDLGIGKNNKLLWHLPEDMKRFVKITYGKTVVMGKKTWESLPKKPLPGRKNVVITDIPHDNFSGAVTAYSIEDALNKCNSDDENIIIGGGTIYSQFMPLADRLYITHVLKNAPADVFFPEIDSAVWEVIKKEDVRVSTDKIPYVFTVYERKK